MPDVFAFLNPNDPDKLVLSLNVNPFANASENPSYRFAEDYLYQFKIDNNGDAIEDFVVQTIFSPGQPQPYEMRFGPPNNPNTSRLSPVVDTLINVSPICQGKTYHGSVNGDTPGIPPGNNGAGRNPQPGTQAGVRCFVGIRDDPFVTDVGQAVFRIGLNPNPTRNFNGHEQDVFREVNPALRGRPLDPLDNNSGLDGFGGFNATVISIEIPKSFVTPGQTGNPVGGPGRPSGAVAIPSVPACPGCINVWATSSIAKSDNGNERIVANQGQPGNNSSSFQQFERMGQQLFNTVWIFAQPPTNSTNQFPALTDADIKNFKNQLAPQHDVANFAYLIPDALVQVAPPAGPGDSLGGIGENNVSARAAVLTAGGFTAPGNGVPLLLPQLEPPFNALRSGNTDKRLLEGLLLADVIRLDLNRSSGQAGQPGASATGNSGHDLGVLQFGLQNGRRTADDVTDIILRLGRELADVTNTEGQPGNRRALRCVSAVFPPITGPCSDARITAVLQGTDFIEPDAALQLNAPASVPNTALNDLANSGNDRLLNTTFPFFASQHPTPGELGQDTTGFPRADDPAQTIFGGVPNDTIANQ